MEKLLKRSKICLQILIISLFILPSLSQIAISEDYEAMIEEGSRRIIEEDTAAYRTRQAERMRTDLENPKRSDKPAAITAAELEALKRNDPKPAVSSDFLARHRAMLEERKAQEEMTESVDAVLAGTYETKPIRRDDAITEAEMEEAKRKIDKRLACVSGTLSDTHIELLAIAKEAKSKKTPTAEACAASFNSLGNSQKSFCDRVLSSCAGGETIFACQDIDDACYIGGDYNGSEGCDIYRFQTKEAKNLRRKTQRYYEIQYREQAGFVLTRGEMIERDQLTSQIPDLNNFFTEREVERIDLMSRRVAKREVAKDTKPTTFDKNAPIASSQTSSESSDGVSEESMLQYQAVADF
ncbi:MAG: hypothetical protein ABIA04_04865 [Pseudomonadota bacterium]